MAAIAPALQELPVYSVTEISHSLKSVVEKTYSRIRVQGEVSGLKCHSSGHTYFALKDADAVMDAVAWRGSLKNTSVSLDEGMEVIATGRLTTYPGRSKYQMVVEQFEPTGQGALLKLLEERKMRLFEEGLFDPLKKKPLPAYPTKIGIVTSPGGAVLQDILHRLEDRFPCHVMVWPVLVQGPEAAAQVAAAIEGFNQHPAPPDLIIVARGGGSLEDLWAFNEEIVVRAVAASIIPLISAVGHETDTTLIDHVSDLRAPTPTAAAEMAVPVLMDIWNFLQDRQQRLTAMVTQDIINRHTTLAALARGLPDLTRLIEDKTQRLEDWAERLPGIMVKHIQNLGYRLTGIFQKIRRPHELLNLAQVQFNGLNRQFSQAAHRAHEAYNQQWELLGSRLTHASYEGILEKGFCWTTTAEGGIISRAAHIKKGAALTLHFIDGATPVIQARPFAKYAAVKSSPGKGDDRQQKLF